MRKTDTKEILQRFNLAPHKKLGQNFLIHPHTAESISKSANVTGDDCILEVGVGLGALTKPLARTAKKVIGVEIDSGLVRYHREENDLPDNVTLLHDDILKMDFQSLAMHCEGKLKIVANLPYSISNPFIFKLIDNRDDVQWAVVMLQKEVADRLCAAPSTKEYGIPSVILQSCARIEKLLTVKPHEFHPQPKIDSVVIRIDFSSPERGETLPPFEFKLFQSLVRAGFSKRRKTLLNNIAGMNLFSQTGDAVHKSNRQVTEGVIMAAGLSPTVRAEDLSVLNFVQLTIKSAQQKGVAF